MKGFLKEQDNSGERIPWIDHCINKYRKNGRNTQIIFLKLHNNGASTKLSNAKMKVAVRRPDTVCADLENSAHTNGLSHAYR